MAGTKASEATPNGGSAGAQGKKKVKAQQPLPAVEALADKLPFCVEVKPKLGRHTVAKADLPAGTLVMLEEPAFTTTRTRVGLHVCHRCFASIPPPSPPKRSKALADKPAAEQQQEEANQQQQIGTALEISKAEGASAQQQGAAEEDEQVPAALNPCLPRYCLACAGKNAELDARLAAVRARLLAVCKKHGVEPELLQLLLLLDTGRAGVKAQVSRVCRVLHPPGLDFPFDDISSPSDSWAGYEAPEESLRAWLVWQAAVPWEGIVAMMLRSSGRHWIGIA